MAKIPSTQKHVNQYRGPSDSEQYNQNSDDVYNDLVYLHNKANELSSDVKEGFSAAIKDLHGISREIEEIKTEMAAVKAAAGSKIVSYTGPTMDDTLRFAATVYAVPAESKLTLDTRFKQITLPKIVDSSVSKLKYAGLDGDVSVPPSLEMVVAPNAGSLDNAGAATNVRTSLPYEAVIAEPGRVWERNIISTNPSGQVTMDLMVKLPTELTATPYSNVLEMIPFPVYGVDVLGIYYSLDPAPSMTPSSPSWVALNDNAKYSGVTKAIGYVPPGGWNGDAIITSPPVSFVFPSKKITALKITLRQANAFNVASQAYPRYLYSYGLSYLDVRYDKFETEGKMIFKITPKSGDTISSIQSVTPEIYNVTQAGLPDVFSYRVIWETAPNSGTYTLTPVPLSQKVWLEVTLKKDVNENLPALTGFRVQYA